MLTREEHVAFCEKCTNRKPSMQGLLCKLTNEKAAFEETCPDFQLDIQEEMFLEKQRKDATRIDYGGNMAQDEVSIMNSGIIGGSLAILGAIAWFFGALIYMDTIFFYPPILFVVGLVALIRGIQDQKQKKRQNLRQREVLDADLDEHNDL